MTYRGSVEHFRGTSKKTSNSSCLFGQLCYNADMKTKQQNTASILAAIHYLINKQRLEPKEIQKLLEITIYEEEKKMKKSLALSS